MVTRATHCSRSHQNSPDLWRACGEHQMNSIETKDRRKKEKKLKWIEMRCQICRVHLGKVFRRINKAATNLFIFISEDTHSFTAVSCKTFFMLFFFYLVPFNAWLCLLWEIHRIWSSIPSLRCCCRHEIKMKVCADHKRETNGCDDSGRVWEKGKKKEKREIEWDG